MARHAKTTGIRSAQRAGAVLGAAALMTVLGVAPAMANPSENASDAGKEAAANAGTHAEDKQERQPNGNVCTPAVKKKNDCGPDATDPTEGDTGGDTDPTDTDPTEGDTGNTVGTAPVAGPVDVITETVIDGGTPSAVLPPPAGDAPAPGGSDTSTPGATTPAAAEPAGTTTPAHTPLVLVTETTTDGGTPSAVLPPPAGDAPAPGGSGGPASGPGVLAPIADLVSDLTPASQTYKIGRRAGTPPRPSVGTLLNSVDAAVTSTAGRTVVLGSDTSRTVTSPSAATRVVDTGATTVDFAPTPSSATRMPVVRATTAENGDAQNRLDLVGARSLLVGDGVGGVTGIGLVALAAAASYLVTARRRESSTR